MAIKTALKALQGISEDEEAFLERSGDREMKTQLVIPQITLLSSVYIYYIF